VTHLALFGVFACGNLGNDASLEAMLANIRLLVPDTEITCICYDPGTVRRRYGIDALPIDVEPEAAVARAQTLPRRVARIGGRIQAELDLWRTIPEHLHGIDHLLFAGTGVLDDFGVPPWNLPYDLYRWCTLSRRAGIRISFVSVGAGPIVHRASRRLMMAALQQADYRSYRDELSRHYLTSIGFDTRQDRVYPDLVFSIPDDQLPPHPLPAIPPRTVGVGVMGYYGWRNSPHSGASIYAAYIAKMKLFVAWLVAQGYAVHLLTGEVPIDERPRDEIMHYLRSMLPAEALLRVYTPPITSTYELLAAVSATDLVVATRYHNVIAALMLGRPVVSAGYSKKNDVLLADMGLGAYCQNVETLDVERLQMQFRDLVATAAAAGERIRKSVIEYRRCLDKQYAYLFSDLRKAKVDGTHN
jgi:polysaccharide pyruvyl transferase WcaK-like protein